MKNPLSAPVVTCLPSVRVGETKREATLAHGGDLGSFFPVQRVAQGIDCCNKLSWTQFEADHTSNEAREGQKLEHGIH